MNGNWLVNFLKSIFRETSVIALIVGAVVNGLLALWVNVAPGLPAWLPSPAPIIQALGLWLELLIAGWAASRIKDEVKEYFFLD